MIAAVSVAFAVMVMGDVRASALGTRVTPPVELVRAGILPAGEPAVSSKAALAALGWGLWRAPIEQKLVNRLYVESGRRGSEPATKRDALLLAELGWRDTPTTQNLMLRYALNGEFGPLIDRGESLLRRGQLQDNVFRFFGALETLPAMQSLLVARLRQHVPWRERYLATMALAENAQFRAARIRTLTALLNGGDRLTRPEVAPLIAVLSAKGDDEIAWRLWRRSGGGHRDGSALADPDFNQARRLRVSGAALTPFDWQLGATGDYAASVPDYRSTGVSLRWNGQGVPIFLAQRLPAVPSSHLVATLTADRPLAVMRYLQPVLTCANRALLFDPPTGRQRTIRYAVMIPAHCRFVTFALQGRVTDDPSPDPIEIASITLRLR